MRQEDEDSDDAISLASVETGRTHASDEADFYDTYTSDDRNTAIVEEAVEQLTEKRTTTRVSALETLCHHLSQYMPPDSVDEDFVGNILTCLRKPSETEAVLGSRALAVIALIYGGDEERFFQRSKNVLEPLAKSSRSDKVKAAAIRALGMACFVCSVEEENTPEVVEVLERYFDVQVNADVCTASLDAWGLLMSVQDDSIVMSDDHMDRFLPKFLNLLHHADVAVRLAAGENIALMYESAQHCGITMPCDDEIVELFRVMSKESSKKNSKKDRKLQRSAFRDVHSTLANGESPHVSFSVKNEMIDIHSWRLVKQFEAIKSCLKTGFLEHIKFNNTVRQILELPELLEERVIDRRDLFDKKSAARKQRSNELKDDRRRKRQIQESFIGDY